MKNFLINIELNQREIANLLLVLKPVQGDWRISIISKIQAAIEDLHLPLDTE